MRYWQMRAIVDRIGEWDGRFNGLDALTAYPESLCYGKVEIEHA